MRVAIASRYGLKHTGDVWGGGGGAEGSLYTLYLSDQMKKQRDSELIGMFMPTQEARGTTH